MKIAITSKFSYDFFSNGLNQNIVLLYEAIENLGIDVFLLDFTNKKKNEKFHHHKFLQGKTVINWWDFATSEDKYTDMLLCPGVSPNADIHHEIKKGNPKSKICAIHYGNNLFSDINSLYFREDKKLYSFGEEKYSDLCLYSPHYKFAKEYLECNNKSESMELPYIWSPKFIKLEAETNNINPEYKPVARPNIAVVEPCLNVSKTNFIPLAIIIETLRNKPHIFNEAYIFSNQLREAGQQFNKHIQNNTIIKNYQKRLFFDPRQKFPSILARDNPIILSHQFYNELNYVYLEALYYNFPLVHNSPPFKSTGYFYKDFNIKSGSNCVINAAEKHNDLLPEQKEAVSKIVEKYSISANQNKIKQIIEKIAND